MAKKKKKKDKKNSGKYDFLTGDVNIGDRQNRQSKSKKGSNKEPKTISKSGDSKIITTETRSWAEILTDTAHWTPLPFTHGMEMELIICTSDGEYITGEDMVFRMFEIVKDANRIMNKLISYEYEDPAFQPMPEYIRGKLGSMCWLEKDEEKGLVMKINYRIGESDKFINIDSFARDGNVTAITYILELVTPVCVYAEELAYWGSILFNLAKKTLPKDLHIVASAFNPASKEYNRGLSQGDHHHIGTFTSDREKVQCYDMIRNFIPHIIGLSVNSPIINNAPTDVVKIRNGRITSPNCVRSLRLLYNTSMLSSNDPKHFIPYLTGFDDENKKYLLSVLQKRDLYDARYQDVFPWTDFETIEVRVMDAQLSICRRIGLGLLVQTLCYKARKLNQAGRWVPDIGSETITFNRKGAISRGLISIFKNVNSNLKEIEEFDPGFSEYYFGSTANPHRYLFQAVQGMFHYLKEELKELNYLYSPFMKPILQSVFGSISYASPPIAEAEYQLSLYDYKVKNGEVPNILSDLIYFTLEYSKDPLQQPLTGELTLPKSMM